MLASRFFMKRKNNTILRATAPTTLLALMQAKLGGMTVTSIKQLLRARRVQLNGAICTRADQAVQAGDEVTILSQAGSTTLHHPKLALIYEDDYLIVVNKKQGLLTVPSNPDSAETTALSILKAYVRKQHPRNNVYVVHRLDRETSGLLVFAKTPQMQEYMRTYWRQLVTKRTYVALVEGVLPKPKDTIEIDGQTYPLIKLEISNTSHPFYTGKSKLVDTAGRVDKFMSRYGNRKRN